MTEEDRIQLIDEFETAGYAEFRIGLDAPGYEALMGYVRENSIPIQTDVDKKTGKITIRRRPWGTLEFG